MKVFDKDGNLRDWAWVQARYGNVKAYAAPPGSAYRIIELREREDFAGCEVRVVDPLDEDVVQGWRDGPNLPKVDAPIHGLPPSFPNRGFVEPVKADGRRSFGWGKGEYYDPAHQEGAHYYWIAGQPSDVLTGIGMLYDTEHAHLEPVYQYEWIEEPEPPEPPEPEPDDEPDPNVGTLDNLLGQLADAMEVAIDLIDEIRAELGSGE